WVSGGVSYMSVKLLYFDPGKRAYLSPDGFYFGLTKPKNRHLLLTKSRFGYIFSRYDKNRVFQFPAFLRRFAETKTWRKRRAAGSGKTTGPRGKVTRLPLGIEVSSNKPWRKSQTKLTESA